MMFVQTIFSGITNGSIYALIAVGLIIAFNATDVINFAHGSVIVFASMIMVTLVEKLGISIALSFIISVGAAALLGACLERLIIRPAKNPTLLSLIIITLGAGMAIEGLIMAIWGKEFMSLSPFIKGKSITVLGATIIPQVVLIIGSAAVIVVFLELYYKKTISGKAMTACFIDKVMARLLGIRASRVSLFSFALSAAVGGVAGILITPITFTSHNLCLWWVLKGFIASVIGGMGNIYGAVLGGFLLGELESFSAGYLSSAYSNILVFLVLIIALYLRPTGILGSIEKSH
ncbi:MAG: branched-chain amino acid ABC transporter permease [Thermodesulfobacteriota bacterium]|jgi:branched-chain amino acid transport system permease protein